MKQAGILTFHKSNNYGAVLQAYALKCAIEEYGYCTHVIDYQYVEASRMSFLVFLKKKPSAKQLIHYCIKPLMKNRMALQRASNFNRFRAKYLDVSEKVSTEEEIAGLHYDLYICGSDQIWNYHITNHTFDPIFFLQFPSDAKKLIYAASSHNPPY